MKTHESCFGKRREGIIKISAVIPCLNEAENINQVHERISNALSVYEDFELIFIDNGSTDETLRIIKSLADDDPRVKYVSFSRNFGFERSFRTGFNYASYEWCVQYDADLQSPPEETHKLVEKALQGYDVVFALREHRQDSFYRIAGSYLQQVIAKYVFRIELPLGASAFRMVRTSVANTILHFPTRTAYFIATVPLVTSCYTTVKTAHRARKSGKSKHTLKDLFSHSFDLFFGFSQVPLSLSWLWFFSGTFCVIFVGLFRDRLSYAGLFALIGGLLILQFLSLAIISEYLKRPVPNIPHHEMVSVKESNIPACQKAHSLWGD